jgi:nucleoid DNA-binding protein
MDKVWKLRQKVNSNSLYKRKQASLVFGRPKSHGEKLSKEILTSLGTNPKNKKEIINHVFKKYSRGRNNTHRKTIETNMEFILNYLKSKGKIKLVSGKYYRSDKSPRRNRTIGKSKLRSVTTAKNLNNLNKKSHTKKKYKIELDIFKSNN